MSTKTAELLTKVAEIIESTRIATRANLSEPKIDGDWLTWEQRWSKGSHDKLVTDLKAAGIPAFFRAGTRTWGVLAPIEDDE